MIDGKTAPYAALLLRVSMGILFILHGAYLKIFVFTMAGTGKYFASLGLPDWWAWVAMLYETLGGLALILWHPDPLGCGVPWRTPALRRLPRARRQRLLVHRQGRWLGIPGVLGDRVLRACTARRRRQRAQICPSGRPDALRRYSSAGSTCPGNSASLKPKRVKSLMRIG